MMKQQDSMHNPGGMVAIPAIATFMCLGSTALNFIAANISKGAAHNWYITAGITAGCLTVFAGKRTLRAFKRAIDRQFQRIEAASRDQGELFIPKP